ncbi:MAG: R3H domain protein [bacterium ADurb.Bin425]|jgi:stage III sporulation protein AA|nr:MAG: R3H domain protein [bacterium ADurb.Bin425]
MDQVAPADDLSSFLAILPPNLRRALENDTNGLYEVVLDLGRLPEARYLDRHTVNLSDSPVTAEDLEAAIALVGEFSGDNRAGIERTLHRISAMRNRAGKIIGLTCRVGRAISGTINVIRDLVESNKSILFLGPPGVGKTTKLREMARVLSDELGKRVIVIDTSNEIAGDGDVPHPAIGKARRMQVPRPEVQHATMIEAVENHTPEVIIIDEIGTEEEAQAARTIAERGVMLIGTAHGNALDNLLKNPTLVDLVGGIQTVTLGDDEARRRGTQKTVLERSNQPTFEVCIEIIDRQTLAVHRNVGEAVDQLLRGWQIHPEIRKRDESTGDFAVVQKPEPTVTVTMMEGLEPFASDWASPKETHLKVYPYAVSKGLLERVVKTLQLPVEVVKAIDEADAILALRSYARAGAKIFSLAEAQGVPVYVVKSNNLPQIQKALREALHLEESSIGSVDIEGDIDETEVALEEARQAINRVMDRLEPTELAPRKAYIRRLQHQLVERFNLSSRSVGDEPQRRLRILPPAGTQKNLGYI